jgi:hypothetical protein
MSSKESREGRKGGRKKGREEGRRKERGGNEKGAGERERKENKTIPTPKQSRQTNNKPSPFFPLPRKENPRQTKQNKIHLLSWVEHLHAGFMDCTQYPMPVWVPCFGVISRDWVPTSTSTSF